MAIRCKRCKDFNGNYIEMQIKPLPNIYNMIFWACKNCQDICFPAYNRYDD